MTPDDRPDRELADAVVHRGDESAFRLLYRRHTPRLYQVLFRLLQGDVGEAEDAVQETWLRATTGLARFRWEAAFQTWLTGIGLNVARHALRARRRFPGDSIEREPAAPARNPDGHLDLERAIAQLPDGYRTVLVLHDVEGWTHEEIGLRLDIAPGTSKSQLFAARRAMRALLDPPGGGGSHGA